VASYATPLDLFERHDVRLVNDLAEDDGQRLSRPDLALNENVLTALADASGAIEIALVTGGRYSVEQLESLDGNSKQVLERTCCDIAMAYLFDRRPSHNPDMLEAYWKIATRHLEALRTGQNIFNLPDHVAATNPTLDGPSSRVYTKLNLIPDRVQHFYPRREGRLPLDRS
jgi:phage gp36-like protein